MAVTVATAKTIARMVLIKAQFRQALRRTTSISEASLAKLEIGFDNHWIQEIQIYGLDANKLCRAQLILSVDWDEHDIQISSGRVTIAIDGDKWTDNTAIEVDEAIRAFDKYVQQQGLRTDWHVFYIPWVNADTKMLQHVRNTLGHVAADPVKRASKYESWTSSVPELGELTVGCYFA